MHVEQVRRLSSLFIELFNEARFIKLLDEAPIGKLLRLMIPDLGTCCGTYSKLVFIPAVLG